MFNNKMTKKDVAKEFVDSFLLSHVEMDLEMAKECAIVAIDKIIKEMDDEFQGWMTWDREKYYKELKKEIKSLN
jgi:hypothetical protein